MCGLAGLYIGHMIQARTKAFLRFGACTGKLFLYVHALTVTIKTMFFFFKLSFLITRLEIR